MTTTAANTTDNGNGRVTLALLSQKLDRVIEDLKDIKAELRSQDQCIDDIEKAQGKADVRMDNMENRVNSWSLANSVGVLVAGILAAVGIGNR